MFEIPTQMPPTDLSKLTKDQITTQLADVYARAKPINDTMVEISMEAQKYVSEIYRRTVTKHTGVEPVTVKCALSISCNVHPNKGVPELVKRIADLRAANLSIIRVEFNENLNEFRFYVEDTTPPSDAPTSNE